MKGCFLLFSLIPKTMQTMTITPMMMPIVIPARFLLNFCPCFFVILQTTINAIMQRISVSQHQKVGTKTLLIKKILELMNEFIQLHPMITSAQIINSIINPALHIFVTFLFLKVTTIV